MLKCPWCGTDCEDGSKFCNACGKPINNTQGNFQQNTNNFQNNGINNNSSDYTNQFHPQDIAENKLFSILCYFGIFLLIPLLVKPESLYIKFHANQGLVLLIFNLLLGVVGLVPIIGWLAAFFGGIFAFVLFIIGIVNAASGRAKTLPLIGGFFILK